MTAADPGTGAPDTTSERDGLGWFCFVLHLAVMLYIVAGWIPPSGPALVFYLVFLPVCVLSWRLNRDSCVLNNLESLIRTGRWRDPSNREEGAWLLTMARETLGLPVTAWQIDLLTYAIVALVWCLGLAHLLWTQAII